LFLMAGALILEARGLVGTVDASILNCPSGESHWCTVIEFAGNLVDNESYREGVQGVSTKVVGLILGETTKILLALPAVLLKVFITIFVLYYLLVDGKEIFKKSIHLLPLDDDDKKDISERIGHMLHGVVYGTVVVALIQGLIATLGYYIFGIPSPILLGMLTTILSLVPVVGTAIVWVPISMYKMGLGLATGEMFSFWMGLGLLIYGVLLIGSSDNLIKPKLIGVKSNIHPVIVLLGVLGGIPAFGFVGFFIGPVLLALAVFFAKIYLEYTGHK